jgi:hypothetical protein
LVANQFNFGVGAYLNIGEKHIAIPAPMLGKYFTVVARTWTTSLSVTAPNIFEYTPSRLIKFIECKKLPEDKRK